MGVIEGKQPRCDLFQRDPAVRAGIVLGEAEFFFRVLQLCGQQSAGKAQSRFRGICETPPDAVLDGDAVHDDFNGVLFVFVERDFLCKVIDQSVHTGTDITGALRVFQNLPVLALLAAYHRCQQGEPGPLRKLHQPVHDLIHSLLSDFTAALRAVRNSDARIQEAEIVINLCHRPNRGAGVLRRGFLVNGNGRRESVDGIHIRFVHLSEKHSGIRAEAFHIAALSFGIDGVKRQAGFPASGESRDNRQLIPWDFYVDVFEVILPRAFDDDVFLHGFLFLTCLFCNCFIIRSFSFGCKKESVNKCRK